MVTSVRETNFSIKTILNSKSKLFLIPDYPWNEVEPNRSGTVENWNQVDKGHLRKIVLVAVSFAPLLMLPTLVARSRCIKLFVSWIFL